PRLRRAQGRPAGPGGAPAISTAVPTTSAIGSAPSTGRRAVRAAARTARAGWGLRVDVEEVVVQQVDQGHLVLSGAGVVRIAGDDDVEHAAPPIPQHDSPGPVGGDSAGRAEVDGEDAILSERAVERAVVHK